MLLYADSVRWKPSQLMASDGAAHAVAPGVPHGAFWFWLYGPPPPQQLTRVVLRLNPAQGFQKPALEFQQTKTSPFAEIGAHRNDQGPVEMRPWSGSAPAKTTLVCGYLLRSKSTRRRRRALWYCDSPLLKLLRQPYWSKSPLLGLGCIDSVAGIQPKGILSATTMYLAP